MEGQGRRKNKRETQRKMRKAESSERESRQDENESGECWKIQSLSSFAAPFASAPQPSGSFAQLTICSSGCPSRYSVYQAISIIHGKIFGQGNVLGSVFFPKCTRLVSMRF